MFIKMSVDRTIEELSGTLAQLGQLVGHINGQINGITSRINVTLDNFDRAITNIATDAGSVTGQVGDTVSQVPNAWVFYVLFITLIIVFILLSIVLLLNLITKIHAIYSIIRSGNDGSEASLMREDHLADRSDRSYGSKYNDPLPLSSYNTSAIQQQQQQQYSIPPRESPRDHADHVAISMEAEPRRPGRRGTNDHSEHLYAQNPQYVTNEFQCDPFSNSSDEPLETETRAYQRRGEESGKYNLETATSSQFPRTIQASDI